MPARYLEIRPGARYFHSLRLLQRAKEVDPTIFDSAFELKLSSDVRRLY